MSSIDDVFQEQRHEHLIETLIDSYEDMLHKLTLDELQVLLDSGCLIYDGSDVLK